MKNVITLYLTVCLSLVFTSCYHDSMIEQSNGVDDSRLEFESIEALTIFMNEGMKGEVSEFRKSLSIYSDFGFKPLVLLDDEMSQNELIDFVNMKIDRKIKEDTRIFGSIKNARLHRESMKALRSTIDSEDGLEIDMEETAMMDKLNGIDPALIPTLEQLPEDNLIDALEGLEVDFSEDDLIQDPYFASVLNIDHEIVINNTVYNYSEKGILYTEVDNHDNLERSLDALSPCDYGAEQEYLLENDVYLITTSDPCHLDSGAGTGSGGGGTSGGSGGSSSSNYYTREDVLNNLQQCDYQSNFLNDIFGPSEKCISKWGNAKRLKTKTWNQNYGIFKNLGLKVKAQKKGLFGIWFAKKISEIELGYDVATFTWEVNGAQHWYQQDILNIQNNGFDFIYNQYAFNNYGTLIPQHPPHTNNFNPNNLFSDFPFGYDDRLIILSKGPLLETLKAVDLLPNSATNLSVGTKDFNDAMKGLMNLGFDYVEAYVKSEVKKGKVTVVTPTPDVSKLKFYDISWSKAAQNENKIKNVFDWVIPEIGFRIQDGQFYPVYSDPVKFKNFNISCYGIGKMDGHWKGGKIVLEQE